MRIAIIHNEYKFLGGEDVVVRQEHALLRRAGNDVMLYLRNNRELDGQNFPERLLRLPKAVWDWDSKKEIAEQLAKFRPQVVHIHNTLTMISPAVFWACREAGIPVVMTLHNFRLFCPAGTFFREGKVCEDCARRSLLQGVRHGCYRSSRAATAAVALTLAVHRRMGTWPDAVDFFIAFHEFARNKMIELGVPAEKILIKPNFMDSDPGQGSCDGDYALYVGRLTVDKGVGVLLKAWGLMSGKIPLRIIGEGPLDLQVTQAAEKQREISYLGRQPREKVLEAMKRARMLIFPSIWYEGFPVTIAESFACGLPVIASRRGAMQDLVCDGKTGLHFSPGDAEDLAAKVTSVWNHPGDLREMCDAARAEYLAKYTAERNYPVLMDIYQRAIRGRAAASLQAA